MRTLIAVALLVGIIVGIASALGQSAIASEEASDPTDSLEETIAAIRAGEAPETGPFEYPLIIRYPIVNAIVAAVLAFVIGRLIIWGRNVEQAARDITRRRE